MSAILEQLARGLLPFAPSHITSIGEGRRPGKGEGGGGCISLALTKSFACVQARAMTVDQVLFGYYVIPECPGAPLQVVVNPEGNEFRSQAR